MNVKTVLAIALAGGALASLGGCSMMHSKGDPSAMVPTQSAPGAMAPTRSAPSDTVNESYVDRVDRQARDAGASVVWINPPTTQDHH